MNKQISGEMNTPSLQGKDAESEAYRALRASAPDLAEKSGTPATTLETELFPARQEKTFTLKELTAAFHTVSVLHDILQQLLDDKRRAEQHGEPDRYTLQDLRSVCERMGIEPSFVEAVKNVLFPTDTQIADAIVKCNGKVVSQDIPRAFLRQQITDLLVNLLGKDGVVVSRAGSVDSFSRAENQDMQVTRTVKTGWFSRETVTESRVERRLDPLGDIYYTVFSEAGPKLSIQSKSPMFTLLIAPKIAEWEDTLRDFMPTGIAVNINHEVDPAAYVAARQAP